MFPLVKEGKLDKHGKPNDKTPADTSPPESGAGRKARVERKASAVERGGVGGTGLGFGGGSAALA